MAKIAVLMSAYNGARFIRCQIDSILNQTVADDLHIFIRDDGSTDGTLDEIAATGEIGRKITLISGKNMGAKGSFLELLRYARHLPPEFEYFSLADQDDQWDADKLEIALARLMPNQGDVPLLYASDYRPVDADLSPAPARHRTHRKPIGIYNAMIHCIVPGHTYVFNRSLLQLVPEPICVDDVYFHDTLLLNMALICGRLIYDPEPHANYRQHGLNQMGVEKNFFRWLAIRLKRVQGGDTRTYARQIRYLYHQFSDRMESGLKDEIERFMASQGNFFSRFRYVLGCRFHRHGFWETLGFKILFIGGAYDSTPLPSEGHFGILPDRSAQ